MPVPIRKRERPAAPTPAPVKAAPPSQTHAARSGYIYEGWREDLGTPRDPIASGALKPGDMIRCCVHTPHGVPGDTTMGFLLRLDNTTIAVYRVTLEGTLRFIKKHKGAFIDAFRILSDTTRPVTEARARMRKAPVLY
jgi:hypothetical protein